MIPAERIRQLISEKPGLKAQQIAAELALERAEVAAALHTALGAEVFQDNAYRWWPRTREPDQSNGAAPQPRTLLANLCRYYLECLSRESGPAIGIPVRDADYVALDVLPFVSAPAGNERALKRLVQKVRRERGQLTLYIGYAIRVRTFREETRIEPVLLYPVDDTIEDSLRPASGIPLFNIEVLKTLPAADSGNVIDEAIQLADELGFTNLEDDLPAWDEIILRLRRLRPDWDWREDLNPYALSHGAALEDLRPGIYNRAILFAGTRSPFTYGLEVELRNMALLDPTAIRETALAEWLDGNIAAVAPEERPILEVLPLNTEQRQAVLQGLSAPLTVVTGPPGTGKSQVVISLLVNAAYQGASVLFSSKNNHAVDVVEARVNELGPRQLLLRLGREEHHARLAQHLGATLAESPGPEVAAKCAWLTRAHEEIRERFAAVQRAIVDVVALRNSVDELERAAEPARAIFRERFSAIAHIDLEDVRRHLRSLRAALDERKLWGRRSDRIAAAVDALKNAAEALGIAAPEDPDELYRAASDRLEWAARVQAYRTALDRLRAARPLNALAGDLTRIAGESAQGSLELWQCWMRLWPARWTAEDRRLLSEYVSLLQMIASGDRYGEGAGRKVFRRYYELFPKVVKLLPCWAVTSLSARGRLPFEPAIFDLLIIDEASQCDIASVLPLLLRARRAVIIGDPLQLKHVSAVAPQQDRMILAAHGLAEGHAAWAYSVNSLFDLARSLCRREDIVNLRDHHRSHRDIIAFSNRHFYRGDLRIATDPDTLKRPRAIGPAVRWIEVRGKVIRPSGGGALNAIEADALVNAIRKLVIGEAYAGTIGAVTPFRAQANRIRRLVHEDRSLSERLAALQFVVDTVHGFQGDERDVIFFSPVVSAGTGESTIRFLKSHGNLFNVAITRARSELVVVGDREAALHSGVSYLAGFAEYARDLALYEPVAPNAADFGPHYPVVTHPELVSDWERVFYRALYQAGLRPVPQYEEPPYTLDFALFGGERKLDIEVDGEHYHRNWDGDLCWRDQIRSRRLADAGWDIIRFWVYEIRDDLPGAVARVKAWMGK